MSICTLKPKITKIPILKFGDKITSKYATELKQAINSDGCTGVSEAFQECCICHDLGYKFDIDPWGNKVTRKQVDDSFRKCMQDASWLGKLFSRWRYPVVRVFGRFFDKKSIESFEVYIFEEE